MCAGERECLDYPQIVGNVPGYTKNVIWKHATYQWASHTWSPQATTNHRACCTRSAWTPQEQCSQEYLLWRRPETRTTRQGGPAAQSSVLDTKSYLELGLLQTKQVGQPSYLMASLICQSTFEMNNKVHSEILVITTSTIPSVRLCTSYMLMNLVSPNKTQQWGP